MRYGEKKKTKTAREAATEAANQKALALKTK
ncbi:MAG: hypothetical protein UY32_C0011G0019, partial [Candidatus Jorgensenbacteria bacterium GW2011_GWC1_48_8]